jgi:hypothetical protein
MHTDPTLELFSQATKSLGNRTREFEKKTCSVFETKELERERVARYRRQEKKTKVSTGKRTGAGTEADTSRSSGRTSKRLNLKTYKNHAQGHYLFDIRHFGTTDSYSTQPVSIQWTSCRALLITSECQGELEHRTSKSRVIRTSGRLIPQQLSKIELRERRIRALREKMRRSPIQTDSDIALNDPRAQYNMGKTQNSPVHLPTFLQKNDGDIAIKVNNIALRTCSCAVLIMLSQNFYSKLTNHLYPRILDVLQQEALQDHSGVGRPEGASGDLPGHPHDADGNNFLFFKNDCIYHHKLTRFHFTTYDVRRGTDIINPGTSRCNVMLLADHSGATDTSSISHHFLYARVLGAYHANIIYTGPGMRDYEARRMDFLWVRWYEVVDPMSSGWASSTLDNVHFLPMNDENAFGFVDPKDVLRTCHIIPNFAKGKRHTDGVGISRCAKDGKDYKQYYVGR